jgi:hypothetical protein
MVTDRYMYRELTKLQRQRYDRGEISWGEFRKHYRINSKMNARLYRKEKAAVQPATT